MSEENTTVLCGGTLLILLLQHRNKITNRSAQGDITEGTGEVAMFWQLCKVLEPSMTPRKDKIFLRNIKSQVREYKQCNQNTVSLIPLTTKKMNDFFRIDITDHRYTQARKLMKTYIIEKINKDYDDQKLLVASILETIKNDKTIKNDEIFYCLEKHPHKINKSDLLQEKNLDLASFLTGILYYVFVKPVQNSLGKETFNRWVDKVTSEKGKIEYRFTSDIGMKFADEHPDLLKPTYTHNTESSEEKRDQEKTKELLVLQIKQQYEKIKTFFDINEPKNFEDIFICNDISLQDNSDIQIQNASIQDITDNSNFVLITGSAGIGKSMMIRHFLLDACDQYNIIGKLPIYIAIWEYQNSLEELPEFFFRKYQSIGGFDEFKEFSEMLELGEFIFFLDGLDELPEEKFLSFVSKINDFTSKYYRNIYVISSRTQGNTTYLSKFTNFEIMPFRKEQAIALIDKLSAEDVKTELKTILEQDFDLTYISFALTPLFLTLMIKNYPEFRDIPKSQHIYFSQLYNVLFREVDKVKGHGNRKLITGLKAGQFEKIFSEFCAISFLEEKVTFTDYEFKRCFEKVNQRSISDTYIDYSDFQNDLTETLGLMIKDGNQIRFWHKAFQEYFCALYYYNLAPNNLYKRWLFFQKMEGKPYAENAFTIYNSMVNSMGSKEDFEKYVMLPYESFLINKCLSENGYWTFLCMIYQTLSYNEKNVVMDPFSGLFKEIFFDKNERFIYKNCYHFPQFEEFCVGIWVKYREDYCKANCPNKGKLGYPCLYYKRGEINIEEFDCLCKSHFSQNDILRKEYIIDLRIVSDNSDHYKDLIKFLDDNSFALKKEYLGLIEECKMLLNTYIL